MTILYHGDNSNGATIAMCKNLGFKQVTSKQMDKVCEKQLNTNSTSCAKKGSGTIKSGNYCIVNPDVCGHGLVLKSDSDMPHCIIDHTQHPCGPGTAWNDVDKICTPHCDTISDLLRGTTWNAATKKCETVSREKVPSETVSDDVISHLGLAS